MGCAAPFKVVLIALRHRLAVFVTMSALKLMRFAWLYSSGEARPRYKHEKYCCILISFVTSHHARVR